MRVLWFTNTASLASKVLNENGVMGGWIASLEEKIGKVKGLELAVAFHSGHEKIKSFEIGATRYFPLPYPDVKGKFNRILHRWKHQIEPDTIINNYLEIVTEFKPDIVHIFGTEQAYGLIIPHLTVPAIIQIQGNITVYLKKWFSGINSKDLFKGSNIVSILRGTGMWHHIFPYVKRAKREEKMFEYCKYFIGRTDWDRRITTALSNNAEYFHCDEVLRKEFYDNKWVQPSNKKMVLFSTVSASVYKGMETILETAVILKKKSLDFEWQIAGMSGDEEIVSIIEKIYKLKFVRQNICFKGSLNAEALIKNLLKANIFIHPSHIENSSNGICEAMLLGMPVIATQSGGTPTIISDKKEGLLVQDGDPYALAGAIIELNNEGLANCLGSNARAKAIIRHDPDKIVNDLLGIYSKVNSKN